MLDLCKGSIKIKEVSMKPGLYLVRDRLSLGIWHAHGEIDWNDPTMTKWVKSRLNPSSIFMFTGETGTFDTLDNHPHKMLGKILVKDEASWAFMIAMEDQCEAL